MFKKMCLTSLLAISSIGYCIEMKTVDGQTVDVAPEEIIAKINEAAKTEGKIIFKESKPTAYGSVVFSEVQYRFNGENFAIFGRGSDASIASGAVCRLLGFNNYYWEASSFAARVQANDESVVRFLNGRIYDQVSLWSGQKVSVVDCYNSKEP